MSAAVTVDPVSGSIISVETAVEVAVTGADANDLTAYDVELYPTAPALTYYLKFSATDEDDLISPVFTPSSDGTAEWHNVILPAAGAWTLDLCDASDDSVVATAAVTVS